MVGIGDTIAARFGAARRNLATVHDSLRPFRAARASHSLAPSSSSLAKREEQNDRVLETNFQTPGVIEFEVDVGDDMGTEKVNDRAEAEAEATVEADADGSIDDQLAEQLAEQLEEGHIGEEDEGDEDDDNDDENKQAAVAIKEEKAEDDDQWLAALRACPTTHFSGRLAPS